MKGVERLTVDVKDNGFNLYYVENSMTGKKWHDEVYENRAELIQATIDLLGRLTAPK